MKQSYMPKTSSDHYQTPERVFDILDEYGYKARHYFDPCPFHSTFDGLKIDWQNWNYVNPPYSLIGEFVHKAFLELHKENSSILLIPTNKTDKDWWHNYIALYNFDIIWIRGRLKFKDTKNPAPIPHCLVIMQ